MKKILRRLKNNTPNFVKTSLMKLKNNISSIVGIAGVGIFLSVISIFYLRKHIIPYLPDEKVFNNNLKYNNIKDITDLEYIFLLLGLFMLMISLLIKYKSREYIFFILVLLLLGTISEFISFLTVYRDGEINYYFILTNAFLFFIILWILRDIIYAIYIWIKRDKNDKDDLDVAKLALIWTVITFVFTLLR
ncbi:hypothetical protein RW115_11980 [Macrococcus capreoli]